MDAYVINEIIEDLEKTETTFNNIQELAALYIVKDHLVTNNVEAELSDILPEYRKYCVIKRKYQLHELTDEAVSKAIKNVCREIEEFIKTLYAGTDFHKERIEIMNMISNLNNKYNT